MNMKITSMGKTYKPVNKEYKKERQPADHGVKDTDRQHQKTEERKLLRHYERNWQDLEDGD